MESTFYRDKASNALINTDSAGLEAYHLRRNQALKVDIIERDINILKLDFEEIKSLLHQLIRKE